MKPNIYVAALLLSLAVAAEAQSVPPLAEADASASSTAQAQAQAKTSPSRQAARRTAPARLKGTGAAAVERGADWQMRKQTLALGEDGRVVYTYGAGMPVVVCSPMQLCIIELQPGEIVRGDIHLGDSVRWGVTPSISGSGKTVTTQLVIKPKEDDLKTTLFVSTDRRSYYLELETHPTKHVTRVSFAYPDDDKAAWAAYSAKQADLARNEGPTMTGAGGTAGPDGSSIEKLSFDYTVEGDAKFKPVRVMDNGAKIYIQLPAGSKADEIPVLVALGADGKEQIVNSRYKNGWFEVDRLFDRAALIIGVGKDQQKVVITSTSRYKTRGFWYNNNASN